jgi:hypothetical protein
MPFAFGLARTGTWMILMMPPPGRSGLGERIICYFYRTFLVFRIKKKKSISNVRVLIPKYTKIGIGERRKRNPRSQENDHRYLFIATTSSTQ